MTICWLTKNVSALPPPIWLFHKAREVEDCLCAYKLFSLASSASPCLHPHHSKFASPSLCCRHLPPGKGRKLSLPRGDFRNSPFPPQDAAVVILASLYIDGGESIESGFSFILLYVIKADEIEMLCEADPV